MLQDFRQCCRAAYQQRRTAGVLEVWFPLLSEAVVGLLAERLASWECSSELRLHERMKSMVRTRSLPLIAVLYVSSLELALIAAILLSVALVTSGHAGMPLSGSPFVLLLSVLLAVLAFILGTIAWIAALVQTARLRRWGWFVALVLLLDLPMIGYLFVGPETLRAEHVVTAS